MKRFLLCIVAVQFLGVVALGQEPPEWASRTYSASIEQVFAAALKSVQEQHHEVQSTGETNHTVDFHVGMTAWSWGYNMRLTASPVGNAQVQVVVGVSRSGGKAVAWGSGKKEVRKILAGIAGIDAELAAQKAGLK